MTGRLKLALCLLLGMCGPLPSCTFDHSSPGRLTPEWTDDDRVRIAQLRNAAMGLREMLEDYYQGSEVLEQTWYLSPGNPGRARGMEFLAAKFARAVVWQEPVIIGAIGSSVTAGYDNCRYDSYPQQLERLLGPVLEQGGGGLEVRNAGQGGDCGNSFENQVWCLPVLTGDDIDIAHYSWTYFETGHADQVPVAHEMFYRWALMMDHGPAPQLVYANACETFQPRDQALLQAYAPMGADVLCMTRGLATLGYERREWGEMGDPLHETSRAAELPGTGEARRKSLAVLYRNWHPGPLLFQMTADAMAWRYGEALLLALDQIAAEPDPRRRWPRKTRGLSPAELPGPIECPADWCGTQRSPVCIDFEQPVFGSPGVSLLATAGEAWVFDPGEPIPQRGMPPEEQDLPQCQHPNRCSGWRVSENNTGGALSFSLPDLELGLVAVCCGSKQCGEKMLAAGARFLIDGQPPERPPRVFGANKCVEVQERFSAAFGLGRTAPPRNVKLDVLLPASAAKLPPITHVFGL